MVLQIKNTKELTQTKTDFSERGLALKVLNRKHFMSHSFVLAFFCTSIIMSRMSSSWTATGCIIKSHTAPTENKALRAVKLFIDF